MKNLTLSLVSMLAISTLAIADGSYPADGANSYKEVHSDNNNNNNGEDVNRKGFRLGIGLGFANTSVDNIFLNTDYSETGFATSFEIGYAPSNQLSINYLSNVNWSESNVNDYTGAISGVSAGGGIAVNYYLDNSINTPYVVGGIGLAHIDSDDVSFAGIAGIGYAMDKVEFELTGVFSTHYSENMRQIYMTVNYMFY